MLPSIISIELALFIWRYYYELGFDGEYRSLLAGGSNVVDTFGEFHTLSIV